MSEGEFEALLERVAILFGEEGYETNLVASLKNGTAEIQVTKVPEDDTPKFINPTGQQILNTPMDISKNPGASTIRAYLMLLLVGLWRQRDNFSGKRPFGNSGWPYDLYDPLVRWGYMAGEFDDDGNLSECDDERGSVLIDRAIWELGNP